MNPFLRAILDDPESDAPRLVYADHLTELGHPHGELILLQTALARSEHNVAAQQRVAQLVDVCWQELAGVATASGVTRFCVRRGFVEAIVLPAKRVDELPAIVAQAPIMELSLTGSRDGVLRLAGQRELLNLRVLDLSGLGLGNRRCVELLRSGGLANVTTLVLSGNTLGPAAVEALVRCGRHMPCLEHVFLDANRLGAEGVVTLVQSALFEQLVSVAVDDEDVDAHTAQAIARVRPTTTPPHGIWFP